jgi:hypothetical protein
MAKTALLGGLAYLLKVMVKLVVAIMMPYCPKSTSIDKPADAPRAARAAYMYSWYIVFVTTPYMSTSFDWTCMVERTAVLVLFWIGLLLKIAWCASDLREPSQLQLAHQQMLNRAQPKLTFK